MTGGSSTEPQGRSEAQDAADRARLEEFLRWRRENKRTYRPDRPRRVYLRHVVVALLLMTAGAALFAIVTDLLGRSRAASERSGSSSSPIVTSEAAPERGSDEGVDSPPVDLPARPAARPPIERYRARQTAPVVPRVPMTPDLPASHAPAVAPSSSRETEASMPRVPAATRSDTVAPRHEAVSAADAPAPTPVPPRPVEMVTGSPPPGSAPPPPVSSAPPAVVGPPPVPAPVRPEHVTTPAPRAPAPIVTPPAPPRTTAPAATPPAPPRAVTVAPPVASRPASPPAASTPLPSDPRLLARDLATAPDAGVAERTLKRIVDYFPPVLFGRAIADWVKGRPPADGVAQPDQLPTQAR